MRLFAEEKTGFAHPLFCVDKSTTSLLAQLEAMEILVRLNAPWTFPRPAVSSKRHRGTGMTTLSGSYRRSSRRDRIFA